MRLILKVFKKLTLLEKTISPWLVLIQVSLLCVRFLLVGILTTALRVQRQFFSWHFVRKAKKPIKSKRRFYLGKL